MHNIKDTFLGLIFMIISVIMAPLTIIAPIYAAIYDARHDYIVSAIIDIVFFPYGIGRGFYLLLHL